MLLRKENERQVFSKFLKRGMTYFKGKIGIDLPSQFNYNNTTYDNNVPIANVFNDYLISLEFYSLLLHISPSLIKYLVTFLYKIKHLSLTSWNNLTCLRLIEKNSFGVNNISNKALKIIKHLVVFPHSIIIKQAIKFNWFFLDILINAKVKP